MTSSWRSPATGSRRASPAPCSSERGTRYHGTAPQAFHEQTLREHEAVFATIEAGTGEAAEHAMYAHIVARGSADGSPTMVEPSRAAPDAADPPCRRLYVEQADWARSVLTISVGAFVVGELSQVRRVRRGATRTDLGGEVLFRAMFFAAILLLPRRSGRGARRRDRRRCLGLLPRGARRLARSSASLVVLRDLGRYFTVVLKTSEDQPVVDRGPYRVLRHPSYTGLLLAFAGCGLMLGNWVSAAGSVALLLTALVHRIRIEERALTAALGDRYRTFAAGRARLVPFVW